MNPGRRVLFCTLGCEPGPVGGAERQAMRQAKELVRRGYSIEMVCPRAPGTATGSIEGVAVHRLWCVGRRPLRTITYLLTLTGWLALNLRHYQLVHVHLANLQADVVGVLSRITRVPMYVKVAAGGPRGEIGRLRRLSVLTRFVGLRSAKRVQAISDEIATELIDLGIPAHRIVRIPNGYATEDFQPVTALERARRRTDLGLPATGVLVLYAGRFARYKGVHDLIDAWRAADLSETASLVLVGEPAVDAPIGDLPEVSGMLVREWTPRIGDYYAATDVFVLPSHVEGMSNALLEAMACGMPVIATRVGAATSMIDDPHTGILVDAGDVTSLTQALLDVVHDPVLRESLGSAAAGSVASRFGIGAVVDQIESVYELIIKRTAA